MNGIQNQNTLKELTFDELYQASLEDLQCCYVFTQKYSESAQQAFLNKFKNELTEFCKLSTLKQYYVIIFLLAAQRLSQQVSLPYLLDIRHMVEDICQISERIFNQIQDQTKKIEMINRYLDQLTDLVDNLMKLSPQIVVFLKNTDYKLPPARLTALLLDLVMQIVYSFIEIDDLIQKMDRIEEQHELIFKHNKLYQQPIVLYHKHPQQSIRTIETVGEDKYLYVYPWFMFSLNNTFIESILSIDEELLKTNQEYFNLIKSYFESTAHVCMITQQYDEDPQTPSNSLIQNTNKNDNNTNEIKTCAICYDDFPSTDFIKFNECPHVIVCKNCFNDMIKQSTEPTITCPICKQEIHQIEFQTKKDSLYFQI